MRLTAPTVRPEVSILDEAESVNNTTGSDNHVMVASGLGAGKGSQDARRGNRAGRLLKREMSSPFVILFTAARQKPL
jgi:hypothetical protein